MKGGGGNPPYLVWTSPLVPDDGDTVVSKMATRCLQHLDGPTLYKEEPQVYLLVATLCHAQATAHIRLASRSKRGGRNPSS